MAAKPWMTSADLIESVKLRISVPISQSLYTENDILTFANEEMKLNLVPSVLSVHEEYYVYNKIVPLVSGQVAYSIPDRAVGMRLREIFYVDSSGNSYEMANVDIDDQAEYGSNYINSEVYRFRFENNDVVLDKVDTSSLTGSLKFVYFLRPNELVLNARASISQYFVRNITVNNASIVPGDVLTIGSGTYIVGTDFVIGASSQATASNITTMLNAGGNFLASNGSPPTSIVSVNSLTNGFICTSNSLGFVVSNQGIQFDQVPTNITNGALIDFLQTKPGHKTYSYDVQIPINGISSNVIFFQNGDIPSKFIIGDYICLASECIIPQIPPDFHTGLAERTALRILMGLGDQSGIAASQAKVQEYRTAEGILIDQRSDGNPKKFVARKGMLGYNRLRNNRGF